MATLPFEEEAKVKKEKKLIIDAIRHNCSHCGTKSARYTNIEFQRIDIENRKQLYAMFLTCCECGKRSMHLIKNFPMNDNFLHVSQITAQKGYRFDYNVLKPDNISELTAASIDTLDENVIMSIPTPTFIIDSGIPNKLRDLLIEAHKCIKENALTGASACIRKAIYQFLIKEKAQGNNYDEKITAIKKNWSQIEDYLDVLKGIKGITSDQVHEDSFASFDSDEAKSYVAILEEIFREVYVIPEERKRKKESIMKKFSIAEKAKKEGKRTK